MQNDILEHPAQKLNRFSEKNIQKEDNSDESQSSSPRIFASHTIDNPDQFNRQSATAHLQQRNNNNKYPRFATEGQLVTQISTNNKDVSNSLNR